MIDVRRGDVVDIDFEPVRGHEIGRTRPAVVVQNDIGNQYRTCFKFSQKSEGCRRRCEERSKTKQSVDKVMSDE